MRGRESRLATLDGTKHLPSALSERDNGGRGKKDEPAVLGAGDASARSFALLYGSLDPIALRTLSCIRRTRTVRIPSGMREGTKNKRQGEQRARTDEPENTGMKRMRHSKRFDILTIMTEDENIMRKFNFSRQVSSIGGFRSDRNSDFSKT